MRGGQQARTRTGRMVGMGGENASGFFSGCLVRAHTSRAAPASKPPLNTTAHACRLLASNRPCPEHGFPRRFASACRHGRHEKRCARLWHPAWNAVRGSPHARLVCLHLYACVPSRPCSSPHHHVRRPSTPRRSVIFHSPVNTVTGGPFRQLARNATLR